MIVYVNKEAYEVDFGTTLQNILQTIGISDEGYAVAINYAVIPKENWGKVILEEGAKILVIKAVSGG